MSAFEYINEDFRTTIVDTFLSAPAQRLVSESVHNTLHVIGGRCGLHAVKKCVKILTVNLKRKTT
jgi:hypothetical protein